MKRMIALIAFLLPAIIGGIGYILDGNRAIDAFYQSVGMYFFDANTTDNNWLVEISRWLAPIMTISGIALLVKEAWNRVKDFFVSFSSDAVALYGDETLTELTKANMKHSIIAKNNEIKDVKSHILLFESEDEGIRFYMKNRKALLNREVYIKLDSIDCLQAAIDHVRFFNINEMIAREFWKTHPLTEAFTQKTVSVSLIGSGNLLKKLLYYGFLNNLYTINQKIVYHIWGACDFADVHRDFLTMNGDEVVYHTASVKEELSFVAQTDRIILAEENGSALLDELTKLTTASIFCYDSTDTFVNVFGYEKIFPFGSLFHILTAENIRTDKLQRLAKQINYEYEKNYGSLKGCALPENQEADTERLWASLSPFLKSSNLVAGDYQTIRLLVMEHRKSWEIDEEICELEHIRWCRYHLLNHWKYGSNAEGKKDKEKKLHPCLKPFSELPPEEHWKDRDTIAVLMGLA
ncbi:MAG: hypothetical protein J6D04_01315 [Clostridia bacterium]|nr:hypothetical protein [Clostridia bacterium]